MRKGGGGVALTPEGRGRRKFFDFARNLPPHALLRGKSSFHLHVTKMLLDFREKSTNIRTFFEKSNR